MVASVGRQELRWRLLTTVSAVSLLVSVYGSDEAIGADQTSGRPTVWIEFGGQMERASGQGDVFVPAFLAANASSAVLQPTTPVQAQRPSKFSFGGEGKISIQPESSDWVFSAALRYGRSGNVKHVHHQTPRAFVSHYISSSGAPGTYITTVANFADTLVKRSESHAVLDFSVGRDVGVGMFGKPGSSILSFGVRFAQFTSKESMDLRARPDLQIKYFPSAQATGRFPFPYFHTYHATGQASRSFHGMGPAVSWSGSLPVIGHSENSEITFDWGANAAILFGRQRTRTGHQETARYWHKGKYYSTVYQNPLANRSDNRFVTVPNIGGFAGASWHAGNFKASVGYRADFFFGAIDGGIDTRKSETLGFYGPFATISYGLGG